MALPRDQRFQNLTVDFKKMNKLSMRDRMNMLGTRQGADLLSSLDPSQLKSLFPDYYKKDEGLSQTLSAITGRNIKPSETVKDQTAGRSAPPTERDLRRRNTANRAREEERLPEWARKLGVTAGKSDMPQLTSDQKTVLKDLRQGKIASDDPRVAFIANMAPEARQKAGIIEVEDGGKKSFSMSASKASQMTDEEVASSIASRSGGEGKGSPYIAEMRKGFMAELQGNPELKDRFMRAMRAEAGGRTDKLADVMEATMNRAAMRGQTIDQQLRSGFFQPINKNHSNYTRPLDERTIQSATEALGQVGQGRNRIQLRTDQGLSTDPSASRIYEKDPQNWGKLNFGDGNNYYFMGERGRRFWQKHEKDRQEFDASVRRTAGRPPTPEEIAQERARIEKEEQQQIENNIASSQPRPQLPAGLDPKFVETYNRLPIAQAQQVAAGLGKVSQELGEAGIRKFNTEFLGNPKSTMSGVIDSSRFSDSSVADRFNQMRTSTQDASQRFLSFSPDAKITSTYRDTKHQKEREKRTLGAHSRGEAIDVRTEGFSTEQIQQKVASLKRAGFNYVLLEGNPPHIHAEIREGRDFEIRNLNGGNPSISLEQAQQAAAGAKFRDFDETQQQPQQVQQTPPPISQRGMLEYAGRPTQQAPQQAQQTPPPISQTERPTQQAQSETPEVAALSYGGEVQTNAEQLTAVPMGQARTDVAAPLDRRDNMAVIDEKGQTQFTINDNETVSLKNGKAEVQTEEMIKSDEIKPIQDSLKREERENEKEQANRLEMVRSQAQTDNQINDTNMQNINDSAVSATEELFRTPSFTRAMKERHFMKDESPMGGNHFSPV